MTEFARTRLVWRRVPATLLIVAVAIAIAVVLPVVGWFIALVMLLVSCYIPFRQERLMRCARCAVSLEI